jgi:hypothetical protein
MRRACPLCAVCGPVRCNPHEQLAAKLLDHLVGAREQHRRNFEAERLEVDR